MGPLGPSGGDANYGGEITMAARYEYGAAIPRKKCVQTCRKDRDSLTTLSCAEIVAPPRKHAFRCGASESKQLHTISPRYGDCVGRTRHDHACSYRAALRLAHSAALSPSRRMYAGPECAEDRLSREGDEILQPKQVQRSDHRAEERAADRPEVRSRPRDARPRVSSKVVECGRRP